MLPPLCSSSSCSFWLRQEADVVLPMGARRVGGGWLKRKKPTPSPGQTIASRNLVCSQLRVMSSIGGSERCGTCRPKMRPVCMTSRMTKLDPERLDDRAVISIEERQPTMSGSVILLFFFRDRNQLTIFVFLRVVGTRRAAPFAGATQAKNHHQEQEEAPASSKPQERGQECSGRSDGISGSHRLGNWRSRSGQRGNPAAATRKGGEQRQRHRRGRCHHQRYSL